MPLHKEYFAYIKHFFKIVQHSVHCMCKLTSTTVKYFITDKNEHSKW